MTPHVLDQNRLLAEIGISEQEEQAYRLLLVRSTLTVQEASELLHLADAESIRLLSALEANGLASRLPGPALRFLAATPELAIEALILKKQATLERTRSAIALLKRDVDPSPPVSRGTTQGVIEVVSGNGSILQAYELLHRAARCELRCLTPAPFLAPHSPREREPVAARQVRHLHVLDAAVIEDPTALAQIRARNVSHHEWRVCQRVPFRLLIADRQLALLPLDSPAGVALLIRPSALLDEFNALFDMIWRSCGPVDLAPRPTRDHDDSPSSFSSDLEALIPLLATGLNDKAIAHQLRISTRTLMRRVAKLLSVLDARSRFQAGWSLALQLHGITAPDGMHISLSRVASEPNSMTANQRRQRSARAQARMRGSETTIKDPLE